MISALFEANLFKNKNTVLEAIQNPNSSGHGRDDEDLELVTEIITNFSLALTDEDDLSEAFEDLCSYYDLDDEDASLLADILIEASMDESDNDNDASDDAIEKNVRSLLKFLSQPFPKATSTSPNREGLTPLANERGVKKFLATLTVSRNPDPYGNGDAFSAKDVAVYGREKNHHGHPNVDFNNQKPSRPLAAATRDVSTGNQQFEFHTSCLM